MALPKQRKDESDADYAVRAERAKEARREQNRKYYEANKEAVNERIRRYREANREAIRERKAKHYEAKVLANAKGKPLQSNLKRAKRPKMLSRLVIKIAEDFCRNYGFPLERKWDTDVLKHASNTIRNSPELDGAANPWYGTDWLHPAVVTSVWTKDFRQSWRDKA